MTALPAKTSFTDAAVTEGGFKAALDDLRDYLSGLLGADGVPASARTALGVNTAIYSFIPAGTKMLFCQASAPSGWTQDTALNDRVLRVVSGTGGGTGGTWTISGLSGSATSAGSHSHGANTGGHVLTEAQMPAHNHGGGSHTHTTPASGLESCSSGSKNAADSIDGVTGSSGTIITTQGGGQTHDHSISTDGSHTHTITVSVGSSWRPSYVNVIAASKD